MPDEKTDDLPPHLMAMWRLRHRAEMEALPTEEKNKFNQRLRRRVGKMSAEDRAQLSKTLEQDWAGLPADKKAKLQERIGGRARKTSEKLATQAEGEGKGAAAANGAKA